MNHLQQADAHLTHALLCLILSGMGSMAVLWFLACSMNLVAFMYHIIKHMRSL